MTMDQGATMMTTLLARQLFCGATALLMNSTLVLTSLPLASSEAFASDSIVRLSKSGAKAQEISLGLDKSIVLELPADAYDILVANPEVADAITRTARRIYLFGKDIGATNIFVFGKDGEQIANLNLSVERDIAGLQTNISKYIEDSDIKVELANDNVILTGTVQTAQDSARAEALANLFINGAGASASIARIASRRNNTSSGSNNVTITSVNTSDSQSSVINLLQILGDDQVTLKVTVAEVSRVVMKQLGVNMFASGGLAGGNISYGAPNVAGLGQILGSGAGSFTGNLGSTTLNSYLNAMEQAGVMKTLAEPTLTAISGEKAEFKVGGQFNLLTSANRSVDSTTGKATDTETITKIDYGIGLEFLPVVLSPGRISLKVRTSVSEPTMEGSASAVGRNLISIRKRLADTTVELPSGGSMMIAGLVRDDVRQAISGFPGISKLPVLGALFRSRDFIRNESELVIIVTPYLVRPVARNKLNRPDDNFNVASDGAGMFLGKLNRVYGTMQTNLPAGRYHGVVGYIYK